MKGQHGIKAEVITSFVLICWEILPSHRSGKRNQTMDRFNKGHCFGHEEHTHTHTQMRAVCRTWLFWEACSFRYETVTRPGKAGPFSALSLSLWEPWPVFMIYDNRAKRGESVPVKQQQKPHRQHTYKPQKYLKKIHFPPQPNVGVPKILLSRKFPILRRVWNGSVRMWLQ